MVLFEVDVDMTCLGVHLNKVQARPPTEGC